MNKKTIIVIGSGLSGIAAAQALLAANKKVFMLDAGLILPEDKKNMAEQLAAQPAWQWSGLQKQQLQAGITVNMSGVETKMLFGSDFASRELAVSPVRHMHSRFYASFAQAGLGNIWGNGLLPMHRDDARDWPIAFEELEPHYQAVLRFTPLAGRHDGLEKILPLYAEPRPHCLTSQANRFLDKMEKNRLRLEEKGMYFGASRLAAELAGNEANRACQQCGMCMYGCPYNVLYSGESTLREMSANPNFTYQPGFMVSQLEEKDDQVAVYGTDLNGQQLEPVCGQRVVLCAGVPSTTRIMLRSLNLFNRMVRIKNSDQAYLPLLSIGATPNLEHELMHTLCQAFFILRMPKVTPYLTHLSVYGYNDLYEKVFMKMLGPLFPLVSKLVRMPLRRMFFLFCYLHSDHSSELLASLENDARHTLNIIGKPSEEAPRVFKQVRKTLGKVSRLTGLYPAPLYKGEKIPGAGNHFGGSFPMHKNPVGLQTDIMGRIPGLSRIHLADASVLPSITATTITLTIMANAHRIANHISAMPD